MQEEAIGDDVSSWCGRAASDNETLRSAVGKKGFHNFTLKLPRTSRVRFWESRERKKRKGRRSMILGVR